MTTHVPHLSLKKNTSYPLFYSDIIENLGINLDDLGLDIPADLLNLLNAFTIGQLLLDPLNLLFNGNNESYVEEIFVDTTVDGILYSVSSILFSWLWNDHEYQDCEILFAFSKKLNFMTVVP